MLNAVFAASYFGGNHDTFRLMNRKQTKEVFCNITLTKKKMLKPNSGSNMDTPSHWVTFFK